MAQNTSALVVGAAIGALAGALVAGMGGFNFLKSSGGAGLALGISNITLVPVGSDCVLGKETLVQAKKGGDVIWKISNACPADQTVTLGNIRTVLSSSATDCSQATEGGTAWPFNGNDTNKRTATVKGTQDPSKPNKGEIKLTGAVNTGSTQMSYHFDVCQGGTKADPRLVIDP